MYTFPDIFGMKMTKTKVTRLAVVCLYAKSLDIHF